MVRPVLMDNNSVVTGFKEDKYEEFLSNVDF